MHRDCSCGDAGLTSFSSIASKKAVLEGPAVSTVKKAVNLYQVNAHLQDCPALHSQPMAQRFEKVGASQRSNSIWLSSVLSGIHPGFDAAQAETSQEQYACACLSLDTGLP